MLIDITLNEGYNDDSVYDMLASNESGGVASRKRGNMAVSEAIALINLLINIIRLAVDTKGRRKKPQKRRKRK